MLKEIPKSDIIVRPFKVYKEWLGTSQDDTPVVYGTKITNEAFNADTDKYTMVDNCKVYEKLLYNSVAAQFYKNPATASIFSEVGNRISYASTYERVINNTIAVISIPQQKYGEGIKPGSVVLTNDPNGTGEVYTDDGYSNLIDGYITINGKTIPNVYGNIFYDRGLIVLTKDIVSGSTFVSYSLDFRSSKTIYENEIFISVLENEFNVSTNPSSYHEDGGYNYVAVINDPNDNSLTETYNKTIHVDGIRYIANTNRPFTSSLDNTKRFSFDDYIESSSLDPTGSFLAPYITTIGLYDNQLNMVAVAKLPKPIKSLPDYPVNFIIRFDT
jgi:hypothetical protein